MAIDCVEFPNLDNGVGHQSAEKPTGTQRRVTDSKRDETETMQTSIMRTNRLNGTGFVYDANGNMTDWTTPSGSVTASYDIDNRMTQITTPSVSETYKYGPGNLRVKKYQGGTWTYMVYGQGGEVLGMYTLCTAAGISFLCDARLRVYFGGRLILNGWTGVKPDRLGSPDGPHGRVYPYGEVSGSVSVDQDETFTTYKRDVSTGLDYAQNRYYAPVWGRFTTRDPLLRSAKPGAPQSWNRYSYVLGDPVNNTDPTGLFDERSFCDVYPSSPECIHFGFPPGGSGDLLEVDRSEPGGGGLTEPVRGWEEAVAQLLKALKDPDCGKIITPKGDITVKAVLDNLAYGIGIAGFGTRRFGKIQAVAEIDTGVPAQTVAAEGTADIEISQTTLGRTPSIFWNDQTAAYRAYVLAHELGHVFASIGGAWLVDH